MILFLRCQVQSPCTPVGMQQGVWRAAEVDHNSTKDPSSIWISDFQRQHDTNAGHDHTQRLTMSQFIQYLQKTKINQGSTSNDQSHPTGIHTTHEPTNHSLVPK